MSILHFNKEELTNLEYSLSREMLSCNRAGGYMSTTIVGCNTRRYHGLMVCPNESEKDQLYVLLSSLDETVIQHGQEFNLGIHQYRGMFEPRGHKYIVDFDYTPTPTVVYRVGGVLLKKELLWVHSSEQLFVRYTLLEAHSDTVLRLRPLMAFRNRHALATRNIDADLRTCGIDGGVAVRMYPCFPYLNMQVGSNGGGGVKFVQAPDWYLGIYYSREFERGYDCYEDLATSGYFEMSLGVGESVVFSASTSFQDPSLFADSFKAEIARRSAKIDFMSVLEHSARQFLTNRSGFYGLIAGYPWYNVRSRETFISLAGCTLMQSSATHPVAFIGTYRDWFENIIDQHVTLLNGGLFGNHLSADTSLWFFHALSQLSRFISSSSSSPVSAVLSGDIYVWEKYGGVMMQILEAYRSGRVADGVIRMRKNGLIWASMHDFPLTWMNVCIDGVPVTRRDGYAVDVNALWYNAVCFAVRAATSTSNTSADASACIDRWQAMIPQIAASFTDVFSLDGERHLADYVNDEGKCRSICANQLLACGLEFSPLDINCIWDVLEVVRTHLLTSGGGVRSLSPRSSMYVGHYRGGVVERDFALHQGTAFVWLLEFYVRASFALRGEEFVPVAKELLRDFEDEISCYGIGSIAELHDGNPPYAASGAISYAPSVGALLSIKQMITTYSR